MRRQNGQAAVLLIAVCASLLAATLVLSSVGAAFVARGRLQRSVDVAALAAAREMSTSYTRLFEPARLANGLRNPRALSVAAYKRVARARARSALRANRIAVSRARIEFERVPYPTTVSVHVTGRHRVAAAGVRDAQRSIALRSVAVARLRLRIAGSWTPFAQTAVGGGYAGVLAYRQGKPMRPDVAAAFDRLAAAAETAGLALTISSALRTDAEQQRLWRQRPDPKWVAPPGTSLHRYGTELDLGPASAYGWLAANARRFGFIQRYRWEAWHFGYSANPRDVPARYEQGSFEPPHGRFDGGNAGVPGFVPRRFAAPLVRAATRWNVPVELLAAQLQAESGFNPNARSPAGALGIAQFMPATARAYGLADPFDAAAAIDAQGHLMSDLLRRFGRAELALAAYNAGAGAIERFGGVPPYAETRAYVAHILGVLSGSLAALQLPGQNLNASVAGIELAH